MACHEAITTRGTSYRDISNLGVARYRSHGASNDYSSSFREYIYNPKVTFSLSRSSLTIVGNRSLDINDSLSTILVDFIFSSFFFFLLKNNVFVSRKTIEKKKIDFSEHFVD